MIILDVSGSRRAGSCGIIAVRSVGPKQSMTAQTESEYSAYSLVPYIVCTFIAVIFSNVLVQDESIWITAIQYLGIGWSVILMVQAMRAVHQYSFGKTLASIIGTIIAMLLILFLAILLLSLFQQVYVFGYSVYTEIMYRIRG